MQDNKIINPYQHKLKMTPQLYHEIMMRSYSLGIMQAPEWFTQAKAPTKGRNRTHFK